MAPTLCTTRCARGSSSALRSSATQRLMPARVTLRSSGACEVPKPGRSGVRQRWLRARWATRPRQTTWVSGLPWSSTTGGPSPALATWVATGPTCSVRCLAKPSVIVLLLLVSTPHQSGGQTSACTVPPTRSGNRAASPSNPTRAPTTVPGVSGPSKAKVIRVRQARPQREHVLRREPVTRRGHLPAAVAELQEFDHEVVPEAAPRAVRPGRRELEPHHVVLEEHARAAHGDGLAADLDGDLRERPGRRDPRLVTAEDWLHPPAHPDYVGVDVAARRGDCRLENRPSPSRPRTRSGRGLRG